MNDRIYHIIYETTNNVNGKVYRGKHSTKNINDGYLGSGDALVRALKKYGKPCFTREILFMAFSKSDLNWMEENIFVNQEFVRLKNTYNKTVGGNGGFSDNVRQKIKKTNLKRYGHENPLLSAKIQEKIKDTLMLKYNVDNPQKNIEIRNRTMDTKIKKYGEDYMAYIRNKGIETKKIKYGDENYTNRDLAKQTSMCKYGVVNYSQTIEGRKKIKDRQIGHIRTVGDKNPNAKSIIIISPTGEVYQCLGNFSLMCKQLGISESSLKKQYTTGKKLLYGKTVGWCIIYN